MNTDDYPANKTEVIYRACMMTGCIILLHYLGHVDVVHA